MSGITILCIVSIVTVFFGGLFIYLLERQDKQWKKEVIKDGLIQIRDRLNLSREQRENSKTPNNASYNAALEFLNERKNRNDWAKLVYYNLWFH